MFIRLFSLLAFLNVLYCFFTVLLKLPFLYTEYFYFYFIASIVLNVAVDKKESEQRRREKDEA